MFRLLVLSAVLVGLVQCAHPKDVHGNAGNLTGDALIEHVNKQGKWQAKSYPQFAGKSNEDLKRFLGAWTKPDHLMKAVAASPVTANSTAAPSSFDALEQWPQCADIIGLIQDQSSCGADWAVSTASAMSDRLCIASNGEIQKSLSALDLMACCDADCGDQCGGGYTDEAWLYFATRGIVTGGNYTADTGCKPFPIGPCSLSGGIRQCPATPGNLFACTSACQTSYKDEPYAKDKYYGSSVLYTNSSVHIIHELVTNGPVVAVFKVYEDFYSYAGGIYKHLSGQFVGYHAVRVIGYGIEDGVEFWKAANSWNTFWGEGGFFRIARGECGFESRVTAGRVDLARSQKDK